MNKLATTSLLLISIALVGGGCFDKSKSQQQANPLGAGTSTVESESTATVAVDTAPLIEVHAQSVLNGTILIDSLTLPVNGWVVAYADDGGKPGKILGRSYVPAGAHTDTGVELTGYTGEKVYLIAHVDAGTAEQFEFPGADMVMETNGIITVTPLSLTGESMKDDSAMEDNTEEGGTDVSVSASNETMVDTNAVSATVDATVDVTLSAPKTVQATIASFSFPAELRIKKGDTVVWTNTDSMGHTVTGAGFDSGIIAQGKTYTHTFTTTGTFDYHCTPHPSMVGKVVVE
jgi:amicyanin